LNPSFHVFEIEGVPGSINWVPNYELKDFGKRPT
jgi:hypothetical protein